MKHEQSPPASTMNHASGPDLVKLIECERVHAHLPALLAAAFEGAPQESLVARLERSYEGTVAADSPEWLYRECEVAYVGQRSSRKANAAGGRFRGRVGRLLFRTTAMYQHVLYHSTGNLAINFIKFRLLGLLPGSVVLRGAVEPEADREALGARWNRTLSENTIRAAFRSPRVAFGPLTLDLGPTSEVRLDTTYLDDRVLITARKTTNRDRGGALFCGMLTSQGLICDRKLRLGHTEIERRDRHARAFRPRSCRSCYAQVRISRGGSSGTPFVFRACAADDKRKDAWKRVAEATPVSAKTAGVGVGALAAVAAGTAARIGTKNVAFAPAVVLALASAKLLTSTGGIVVTRDPAVSTYKNAGQGG